jgi:hypothetical protein
MRALSASDRVGRGFGQAKITDLAYLNQLCHRTNGVLWRRVINAVLILKVDHIQLTQGCLTGRAHIIRLFIHAHKPAVRRADIAKLGRKHKVVAAIFNGFPK